MLLMLLSALSPLLTGLLFTSLPLPAQADEILQITRSLSTLVTTETLTFAYPSVWKQCEGAEDTGAVE